MLKVVKDEGPKVSMSTPHELYSEGFRWLMTESVIQRNKKGTMIRLSSWKMGYNRVGVLLDPKVISQASI